MPAVREVGRLRTQVDRYIEAALEGRGLTLGLAADEAVHGVGANCLWPRTLIATAAVQNLLGGD